MTQAGRVFVKWEAGISDYMKDMDAAQKRMQDSMSGTVAFGKQMQKTGAIMTGMGAAGVGAAALIVRDFSKAGDEIHKMALRTGMSEEALSKWRVAAQRSGTDLNAVETGVKRMQRSIISLGDGLAESTRSFGRLNLTVEDLQRLKPEDQMQLIMKRMADLEDPTLRAAVAQEIFGRSGTQLLPVLEDGAEGLEELMNVASETGEVFDKETAKAAAEFEDALRDLSGSFAGLRRVIAQELMPVFRDWIDAGTRFLQNAREWIAENRELIGTIGRIGLIISGVLAVLGPLIMGIGTMGVMLPKVAAGIALIQKAVFLTNPVLLALAAVALTIAANWDRVKDVFEIVRDRLRPLTERMRDLIEASRDNNREADKAAGIYGAIERALSGVIAQIDRFFTALGMSAKAIDDQIAREAHLARERRAGTQEFEDMMKRRTLALRENINKQTEDDIEAKDGEKDRQLTHFEETEDAYREHFGSLDDIMKGFTDQYGDNMDFLNQLDDDWLQNLIDNAESIEGVWKALAKAQAKYGDDAQAEYERQAADFGRFAGNIIDGNISAAVSSLVSSILSTIPFPAGPALAAAAPSIVRRLMPSPRMFADGGIVHGPTLGMVGEYTGARTNPEVIAPLDKLKGMIGGAGGDVNVNINRLLDVQNLSPENVEDTIFRLTEAAKDAIPAAVEYAKRQGELIDKTGGLA